MAYTTPRTWVTGELVTSAYMNANVRDNVSALANPAACLAYRSGAQSIPTGVTTAIAFDSETYDTDAMHDSSGAQTKLTFNKAGIYIITLNFRWLTNGVGERHGLLRINGATELGRDSKAGASITLDLGHSVTHSDKYAAGEYAEALAYQSSGGALNIQGFARFTATFLGLG